MKKTILIAFFLVLSCTAANAETKLSDFTKGYEFYFFGVNTKTFKEANYWKVGAGVVTSLAVHTGGHLFYARVHNMGCSFDGFQETVSWGYEPARYREFAQAGFIAQNLGGLILTSIPYTRQSDFTKGYVAMAFVQTVTYPLTQPFMKEGYGDLRYSDKYGGNATWEYIGFSAIATHNLLRVNWKKD